MEEKNKKREYKPIDLRTMETLICIMVILMHFFTIFFYVHYRVYVMLVSNIISISAYIILYLGLWRRNYDLSFITHVYFISQVHSLFGCAYLGCADKLLYYGKTHGKNRVCIIDDLDN